MQSLVCFSRVQSGFYRSSLSSSSTLLNSKVWSITTRTKSTNFIIPKLTNTPFFSSTKRSTHTLSKFPTQRNLSITQFQNNSFLRKSSSSSSSTTSNQNNQSKNVKQKEKEALFKQVEQERELRDDEEELIFNIDKRKSFVNYAILAFLQLVFAAIMSNVFYHFAKIEIERELVDKKEEELRVLKEIQSNPVYEFRTQNEKELVEKKKKEAQDVIKQVMENPRYFSTFELVTKFSLLDLIKIGSPLVFSVLIFFSIRMYGLRYIRQIDLLPGGKEVRLGTYRFFGHPKADVVNISGISLTTTTKSNVIISSPHIRFFNCLINTNQGTIFNPEKFNLIIKGISPMAEYHNPQQVAQKLLKKK